MTRMPPLKLWSLCLRRTVSDETSQFIREAMLQTVEVGTAKPARVMGYAIGGKTGTAEKLPRGEKKYLVSFLGAVPALNPEIVIYVIIDEPQNVVRQDDSSLATGLASRIMKELLPALGIYPDGEIDYLLPDTDEENTQDTNDDNPDVQQPQQSEDEQDISTEDQNQTEQNQTEEQTEEPRTENPDEQETEEPHFLNDE